MKVWESLPFRSLFFFIFLFLLDVNDDKDFASLAFWVLHDLHGRVGYGLQTTRRRVQSDQCVVVVVVCVSVRERLENKSFAYGLGKNGGGLS